MLRVMGVIKLSKEEFKAKFLAQFGGLCEVQAMLEEDGLDLIYEDYFKSGMTYEDWATAVSIEELLYW